MGSRRLLQVNELIRKRLGDIIARDVDFKAGVLTTISKVDTTPDLRHVRVSVSVLPESEIRYAMETLRHEKGKIQKNLHQGLYMKPLPKIMFSFDPTEGKADEIEHILKSLENELGE